MTTLPDELLGYRVVRRLGQGDRSTVLLGAGPDGELVALKCLLPGVATASVEGELAALETVAHEHVVRLVDVGRGPERSVVLVLERLEPAGLADVLRHRPHLAMGEVVTVLAPLAAGLAAVHAAGVTHGAPGLRSVLLRDSGAPVLAGFGRAATSPHAADPARHADLLTFGHLARELLGRVPGGEGAPATALIESWGASHADTIPRLEELRERLFALGTPAPLLRSSPEEAAPVRLVTAEPVLVAAPTEPATIVARARTAAQAVWQRVPSRLRRPVWAAVAAGVVATIVIGAALPPGQAAEAPAPQPTSAAAARVEEDPVRALPELLAARAECIRQLSVLCLQDVDEPGQSAERDDVALIGAISDGTSNGTLATLVPGSVELRERMGDAVIVGYRTNAAAAESGDGEPASALLTRTEAGWRIRTIYPGQIPRSAENSASSRRFLTATRKRLASAPSMIRWS